jgi:hypothetical protein
LEHGLAGAESARHPRRTPLGKRKEGVEHTLARQKRHIGRVTLSDRARLPDAPSLGQPDFSRLTRRGFRDARHGIADAVRTGRGNPRELTDASRRSKNAMQDPRRFLHGPDRLAPADDGAGCDARRKRPQPIGVERRHLPSAPEEVAFGCREPIERPLDAIEDRAKQSWAEVDRERTA